MSGRNLITPSSQAKLHAAVCWTAKRKSKQPKWDLGLLRRDLFKCLRRNWWKWEMYVQSLRSGEKHESEKDAKSVPSLRKLRKEKSKDTLGAKESYLLYSWINNHLEQAQTHPGLPDQCKPAGRSVQTEAGSNPHQNKSQIHLSLKTAWSSQLYIKQKGEVMLFSGFQTWGMLFAVSIFGISFLALEQFLMSKSCQKPTRRKSELGAFCKKGLSITTTAVGVWRCSCLPSFERTACKSDQCCRSSATGKRKNSELKY